jgi:hypothetical protein
MLHLYFFALQHFLLFIRQQKNRFRRKKKSNRYLGILAKGELPSIYNYGFFAVRSKIRDNKSEIMQRYGVKG